MSRSNILIKLSKTHNLWTPGSKHLSMCGHRIKTTLLRCCINFPHCIPPWKWVTLVWKSPPQCSCCLTSLTNVHVQLFHSAITHTRSVKEGNEHHALWHLLSGDKWVFVVLVFNRPGMNTRLKGKWKASPLLFAPACCFHGCFQKHFDLLLIYQHNRVLSVTWVDCYLWGIGVQYFNVATGQDEATLNYFRY